MRDPGDCGSQIRGLDKKEERPPLLKKSKTISSDDGRSTPPPHFPGPLLPAVRRVSTLPRPPSSSDLPTATANHIDFTKLSDRDWMFPSFLGPHAASRVKHRRGSGIATSKKEKQLMIDSQTQRFDTNEVDSSSAPTPPPTIHSTSTPLTLPPSGSRSKWRRYYCCPTLVSFPLVGLPVPVYDFPLP